MSEHHQTVLEAMRQSGPWLNTRSREPGLIRREREPISSAMALPVGCFDKVRHWLKLESYYGIGVPRLQLSMPRSTSLL